MRTRLIALIAATAGLAAAAPASAQQISLEVRGGLDRPIGDFRDGSGADARGDAGFGGDVIFNATPRFSVYGGYGWDRFGCEGCGDNDWITSRGFEAGGKFIFTDPNVTDRPLMPWLRAGVVANKAKFEFDDVEATSDTGIGFQASLGMDVPLGQVLSFSPALRYQRFPAQFDVLGEAITAEQTVSYISLDFGLHIHPHFEGR